MGKYYDRRMDEEAPKSSVLVVRPWFQVLEGSSSQTESLKDMPRVDRRARCSRKAIMSSSS